MTRDDREPSETPERRTRTTRFGSEGGANVGDTSSASQSWRRPQSGTRATQAQRAMPTSGQDFVIWLQDGGWRFVLAIAALLFFVTVFLIFTGQPSEAGDPLAEPTLAPVNELLVATPLPTVTPAAAVAAPTAPSATGAKFIVSGTGSEGLFLRADPSTALPPVKTLPEGSEVTIIGEDVIKPERVWKHIRDAQGAEGYAAADFLRAVGP